jgi:hypothetical protein
VTVEDADLARVIERWTTLPEHVRAAILALVGTAPINTTKQRKRRHQGRP